MNRVKATESRTVVAQRPPAPAPVSQSASLAPPVYGIDLADRPPLQRRAAIPGHDDPLERAADRAADEALARLSQPSPAAPPPAPAAPLPAASAAPAPAASPRAATPTVQRAHRDDGRQAAPAIQRKLDPEQEAEATATAALQNEPELADSPADEGGGDDDEGEPIQAKLAAGTPAASSAGGMNDVHRGIDSARGRGRPLEEPVRERMEQAFGADFSGVRVHADAGASALAGSVQALAFTSGRDLFFSERRYDPSSRDGERLLAHELAHVLQQGAAPTPMAKRAPAAAAPFGAIQCAPDPKRRTIGKLYLYDDTDEPFKETFVTETQALGIPAGTWRVEIAREGSKLTGTVLYGGAIRQPVIFEDPNAISGADLAKTKYAILSVFARSAKAKQQPPKPTLKDVTPPPESEGQKGEQEKKGTGEGKGKDEKEKGKGKDEKPPEQKEGEDKDQGGVIPGQEKLGSKYGVFGWITLPKEIIKFLEQIIDLLGDPDEYEAIAELLRGIKEIAEHSDQLKDTFKDSSTLLEIALGIKENKAIDAIQKWVESDRGDPMRKRKKKPKPLSKGVAGLAAKIGRLVPKLRRLLKPIFKVRSGVQNVLGTIATVIEAVSVLDKLVDMAEEASKYSIDQLRATAIEFSNELAVKMREELKGFPAQLNAGFDKFADTDLVQRPEVVGAVVTAITMLVKHPAAKLVAEAIGPAMVDAILPDSLVNDINDAIKDLIKSAEERFKEAVKDLEEIILELDKDFLDEIPDAVLSALQPSLKPGARPARRSAGIANLLGASTGEPLHEDVRTEAENRMGRSFEGVRVHHDTAAAEANERLGANAVTLGRDVYFGPGRFAPESSQGKHLLYHELAHVGQQAEGQAAGLQFVKKDVSRGLTKKVSGAVSKVVKTATAGPSPAKNAEIAKIEAKVKANLIGKTVTGRKSPSLPTGYEYSPKKGPIKKIRRLLAWRQLPDLKIDAGKKIQWADKRYKTYLGTKRIPGTREFEGSFRVSPGGPTKSWDWTTGTNYPTANVTTHPCNVYFSWRQAASSPRPGPVDFKTGGDTPGAPTTAWKQMLIDEVAALVAGGKKTADARAAVIKKYQTYRGGNYKHITIWEDMISDGWNGHHIHPVNWGGHKTDGKNIQALRSGIAANKTGLKDEHQPYSTFWNNRKRALRKFILPA